MKQTYFLLLAALLSFPAISMATGLSAHRNYGESFELAKARHLGFSNLLEDALNQSDSETTPDALKKDLGQLDLTQIPDVGSYPDLENQFKFIRDTRFLKTEDPNFPRRITWLYPDDGCYARAELAARHMVANHFPAPKKIFVFGNLAAKTPNAPGGEVQWWYHVADIYRVGAAAYVLDPALSPAKPLLLAEWNNLIGGADAGAQYTICAAKTFDPDADCMNPDDVGDARADDEDKAFLQNEWDRLIELHRDPVKELGDNPPWLV